MGQQGNIIALNIWRIAALKLAKENVQVYNQWFSHLCPLDCADGVLSLGIPDFLFGDLLRNYYSDLLENSLRDIDGVSYRYELVEGYSDPEEPAVDPEIIRCLEHGGEKVAPQAGNSAADSQENPAPNRKVSLLKSGLTFENFIVGDENRHAFAAAKSASEAPGLYNPLLIYGTNGVGKTHLLHAVADKVHRDHPEMVVRSITCDELLNQFYELLYQKKSMAEFRSSVRDVDVLLVDDIHRLAGKGQIQEEFFNLFNTLYDQGKQIILTSDRQPCEMSGIDKRLTTRFESGMLAEIYMPEYEARLAILRLWRSEMVTDDPVDDEILDFLARNISSSVRRLKGCFFRLSAYTSMSGGDRLTLDKAEKLLHSQLDAEASSRNVSIEDIQRRVATHFGISMPELVGKGRTGKLAASRIVAMALCRELTTRSTTEIGTAFGKTHATVLSAEKRLPELCTQNELLRRSVDQIRRELMRTK